MLETLYATGLRVSELVRLRLRDINFDAGYLIAFGKGRKERLVPIGEVALVAVRVLPGVGRAPLRRARGRSTRLFLTHHGRAMTRQGFWKLIGRYAVAAGSTKESRLTSCAIRLPRTWWSGAPTFAPCRPCWATQTSEPRRSTRTSAVATFAPSTIASTHARSRRAIGGMP